MIMETQEYQKILTSNLNLGKELFKNHGNVQNFFNDFSLLICKIFGYLEIYNCEGEIPIIVNKQESMFQMSDIIYIYCSIHISIYASKVYITKQLPLSEICPWNFYDLIRNCRLDKKQQVMDCQSYEHLFRAAPENNQY